MNNKIDLLEKNVIKNNNNKKKTLENKENEPYIRLFKISEYLNYYRNKVEPNNILIIRNNTITDENKMSKIISKNNKSINNSIKKNINIKNSFFKKNEIEENSDNDKNETIYVNMLDEENMSYLWYMEAKKKNNKSLNYNINDEYKELFMDINDNYKYNYNENKM